MAKSGPKGPSKPLDEKKFEQLVGMIRIQCTREEICNILGMSEQTLTRRLKERGEGNFETLLKKYGDEGKASLRRQQWKAAQGGNSTMLVWLGKQMLGQKDKHEHGGPDGGPIPLAITRQIIDERSDDQS